MITIRLTTDEAELLSLWLADLLTPENDYLASGEHTFAVTMREKLRMELSNTRTRAKLRTLPEIR